MPRIFIGIKVSEKIENLAVQWAKNKKAWLVRWIKPENLHLTLVPPFYEDDIEKIALKLTEVKAPETLVALHFHTISYGPSQSNYRLIWATGEPSPELEKIKAAIEKKLNLKAERRSYLPHLTLARFRSEDYEKFKIKKFEEKIDWEEEVKFFAIFESILKPEGAIYKIIQSF